MAGLFLINSILSANGIVWAGEITNSSFLIVMAVICAFNAELIFRGAYLQKQNTLSTRHIVTIAILFLFMIFGTVFFIILGLPVVSNGALTDFGGLSVIEMLISLQYICLVIKALKDKKANTP